MSAQLSLPMNDKAQRTTQLQAVCEVMATGGWWSLAEIVAQLEISYSLPASEAGVSARIRELHILNREYAKRIRDGHRRLHEYRMVL